MAQSEGSELPVALVEVFTYLLVLLLFLIDQLLLESGVVGERFGFLAVERVVAPVHHQHPHHH